MSSVRFICGTQDYHKELEKTDKEQMIPSGAYDGKVVTSDMVLANMSMWARWGHPCGEPFNADLFMETHPEWVKEHDEFAIEGLRIFDAETPNPWTIVGDF